MRVNFYIYKHGDFITENVVQTYQMDVILYCGQEANFQTRWMLIPVSVVDEHKVLRDKLQLLRDNAKFDENLNGYVFYEKFSVSNNLCSGDDVPDKQYYELYKTVSELTQMADGLVGNWANAFEDDILYLSDNGFDHEKNFKLGMSMERFKNREINVVEGFLVLEDRKN